MADRRIALCMPVYGGMVSLGTLRTVAALRGAVELHSNVGPFVSAQRNALVRESLEAGATHVWFLDADVECDPGTPQMLADALERTGAHVAVAVVACKPQLVAMYGVADDLPRATTAVSPNGREHFDPVRPRAAHVSCVGRTEPWVPSGTTLGATACMMISAETFARIDPPWFAFVERAPGQQPFPEDWRFCLEVQRAGMRVAIDPRPWTRHYGQVGWEYLPGGQDNEAAYNAAAEAALAAWSR